MDWARAVLSGVAETTEEDDRGCGTGRDAGPAPFVTPWIGLLYSVLSLFGAYCRFLLMNSLSGGAYDPSQAS